MTGALGHGSQVGSPVVAAQRPGFMKQALITVQKDLLIEGRTGEVLLVTVPFGALALLLIPIAIGTDTPTLSRVGIGMFWVVAVLFGMLVTQRATATDSEATSDLFRLIGVDPAAVFVGRTLASAALLIGFEAVTAPVAIALYSPSGVQRWPWLIPTAILVAFGLAAVGTLAGEITAGLRGRSTLAPLLVAPAAAPLLFAAGQVSDLARSSRTASESLVGGGSIISWILLMLAMDIGVTIAGILVTGPLGRPSGNQDGPRDRSEKEPRQQLDERTDRSD